MGVEEERPDQPDGLSFLAAGGEMGARMRDHDWSTSPLGAPHSWPQSLRSLVGLMLGSSQPMFVAWGPDRTLLYNDPYAEITADKHPAALGRDVLEVWHEIASDLAPIVARAYAGEPVHMDDIALLVERRGYPEKAHFSFSYSPVRDESGGVAGFFCACTETTAQVAAERKLAEETERQRRLFEKAPGFTAILSGPEFVFEFVNEAYTRLFSERDYIGRTVREVFQDLEGQGIFELLEQVYETGERFVADGIPIRLQPSADDPPRDLRLDFIYEPIKDAAGRTTGLFAQGNDVTARTLAEEAVRATWEKERFLVALGDSLRLMSDPAELVAATTRALGERLGATRVVYSDIVEAGEVAVTEGDWTDGTAEHLPERVAVADFGAKLIEALATGATLVVPDVRSHPATLDSLAALDALGVGAMMSVPLVKEGRFAANLNVHSRATRDWTPLEIELVEAVAERTWEVIARARAIKAVADRERELQTLTDTLPVLISYVDAEERYRFNNKAYEDWFGQASADLRGRSVRDVVGESAYAGLKPQIDRALSGERISIEQRVPYKDGGARDVRVEYVPRSNALGANEGYYVLIQDVSERHKAEAALRASEARLRFLDRLGAETASLSDADAVLAATTRLLGEHLTLSVCAYADMDEDEDGFTIRGDWAAPGSTSIVGHYSLADFGKLAVRKLSAGEPLIVGDIPSELAPEESATFQAIGIAATICMPLVKEGRLTALMAIHDRVARAWTDEELSLLREVTERSWAHVERVGAAAELRKSEEQLRELNETLEQQVAERTAELERTWRLSQDLLVVCEPDGKISAANNAWTTVLGWEIRELVGTTFMELTHPDDLEPTLAVFRETLESPLIEPYEYRLRRKDGSYRRIAWTAALEDGRVFANGRDVTVERAQQAAFAAAEAARREADALYRAYFENTAEALFVVNVLADGGFSIEDLNPAHQASIGLALAEVGGRRIDEILPPSLAEAVVAHYQHVLETDAVHQYREVFELHDGPSYWDTVLVPVRDATGRIVRLIGSSRDLSRQMAAEEQLRQSQKMEAMGQLTGGVAHDFNNLLTPIMGSLDLLMRRGLGNEREQRLIDGAMQSAERAKTLVQRLLAFARRQPLQATAVDLAQLVNGMAGLVGSTLGPKVEIRVALDEDLPPARADANQLEMALLNLAVNARDAMPDGGVLTIAAARESVRDGNAAELRRGHYVRLSVADTGAGMDAETLRRAVEPFFSTKGIGKGTGLGLSMVHGLAAQLGGGLTMTSAPDQGTTVELWLPISIEPLEDGADAPGGTPEVKARGRVLLVDDEVLVRMSTADMLTDLGYDVVEAGSGEEALALLRDGGLPDLLVTDHLMPGMSGADLAREARALDAKLPILIVSGYSEVDGIAPDLPRLTKPFRNAELAERLAGLMQAG